MFPRKAYAASKKSMEPKFKFGEEVPKSVKDAMRIDKEMGFAYKDSWMCAIDKERKQIDDYQSFPIAYERGAFGRVYQNTFLSHRI